MLPRHKLTTADANRKAKAGARQAAAIGKRLAKHTVNPNYAADKVKRRLRERAVGFALEKVGINDPYRKACAHRAYSVILEYDSAQSLSFWQGRKLPN